MNREDYIQVTLTDEDDVPDGLQETACDLPEYHAAFAYDNQRTKPLRRSMQRRP